MRIGFFTYGVTTGYTGIGRYIVELTRALRRVAPDAEIVLITPYPDLPLAWYREFEIYPVPRLRLMPAAATLGHAVLHRAAGRLGLDVLHDPCAIVPFLAPRTRYARVTTVHDAIPVTHPRTQPLLTRLVYQTLVRSARFTADAILTVSRAAADDLVEHLGLPAERIHVTPNGVHVRERRDDSADVAAALGVVPPYLLYVGALHPRKNVGRIVEAFRRLLETHPDVRLVIVGPPSWGAREALDEVLRSVRASDRIVFTGYVPDDALFALYDAALALVLVSLYEGFGLPALEAMAHGTPVIASNTSSLPEVVGDAGLLVDPLDTAALHRAMVRMVGDGELRDRLGRKGSERAREFSWDATARATLDVYERVLSERASR